MSAIVWRGDERVLDIGCGAGSADHAARAACRPHHGHRHRAGLHRHGAAGCGARPPARSGRFRGRHLQAIAFPDATFDHIFSICVLEHIPEHEAILAECLRILKPGGRIHFSVDSLEGIADPALVESHQRQHHVVQYYREPGLRQLLEGQGYADVSVQPLFRSGLARRLFTEGHRARLQLRPASGPRGSPSRCGALKPPRQGMPGRVVPAGADAGLVRRGRRLPRVTTASRSVESGVGIGDLSWCGLRRVLGRQGGGWHATTSCLFRNLNYFIYYYVSLRTAPWNDIRFGRVVNNVDVTLVVGQCARPRTTSGTTSTCRSSGLYIHGDRRRYRTCSVQRHHRRRASCARAASRS